MTGQPPPMPQHALVLAINGGSSSIKFAAYRVEREPTAVMSGAIDRIGLSGTTLSIREAPQAQATALAIDVADFPAAAAYLVKWLDEKLGLDQLAAVGHRIVHGMQHSEPEVITPALVHQLRLICDYDPDHLPAELALIEAFGRQAEKLPQVACFDTAFHCTMPRVASLLPIPRRYDEQGIRRYGFHGLSYAYLMEELARVAGERAARGRVILAHLGNGASLAAVRDGRSIDTSMGFTPTGGVPMGTRSGDLDPGVAWYLLQSENLTPQQFNELVNRQSGLRGMSETAADMRELLACEASDPRAAEAVAVFCYQVKKWIGAFAAALGGLDTLVFSGGVGENAAVVRQRICAGLEFLGIELDAQRNAAHAPLLSHDGCPVSVRVMHTDEQQMIVRSVCRVLGLQA